MFSDPVRRYQPTVPQVQPDNVTETVPPDQGCRSELVSSSLDITTGLTVGAPPVLASRSANDIAPNQDTQIERPVKAEKPDTPALRPTSTEASPG